MGFISVQRFGDKALCGDSIVTGSINVLVNSRPCAKLGDIVGAGGVIVGLGNPRVLVNGLPISCTGDFVTGHPPCSIENPQHCSTVTGLGSIDVLTGLG